MIPRAAFEGGTGSFKLVPEGNVIRPGEPYVSRGGAFRGETPPAKSYGGATDIGKQTGIKETVYHLPELQTPKVNTMPDTFVGSRYTGNALGATTPRPSNIGLGTFTSVYNIPSVGMSTPGSNGMGTFTPRTPSVGMSTPTGNGIGSTIPRSGVGMSMPRGNEIGTFTPRTPSVGMTQPRPNEIKTVTPNPRNEIGTFTPREYWDVIPKPKTGGIGTFTPTGTGYDFWINPKPVVGEIGRVIPDDNPPPPRKIGDVIPDEGGGDSKLYEIKIIKEEPPPPPIREEPPPSPKPDPTPPIGGGGIIIPPFGGGGGGGGGAAASKPGRGSSFSARYNYGQGIGDMFGSMRPLNFSKSAPAPRKKSRRK
jgi:hypothetical protein